MKRWVVVGMLAWIAWAHESTLPPSGREKWSMSSAHETRDECSRYIGLGLTELMRRNADPNVKRVGDAWWFIKTGSDGSTVMPITQIGWECWPDTVEPRGVNTDSGSERT